MSEEDVTPAVAETETEGEKRQSLLVVDDERDVALGLAALLRARGYDVELARDYYRHFVELWGDGDLERDRVAHARRFLDGS